MLIYFRHDIWRILTTWFRSLVRAEYRGHLDARMGWYIIIGSLPIVVAGRAAQGRHQEGLPRAVADRRHAGRLRRGPRDRRPGRLDRKQTTDITLRDAVLMGLAQACALVPGVSRSGRDALDGPVPRLDREAATRYAFLLADPRRGRRRALRAQGRSRTATTPTAGGRRSWRRWSRSWSGYAAIAWLLRYVVDAVVHAVRALPRRPGRRRRSCCSAGRAAS